jgi:histidinol-phosphate aminotransferase
MSDAARTVAMAAAHDEAWFASRASRGVQGLRAYDPGHDLVAFRRKFGDMLVELGSNENPYGPSPAARMAILDQLHSLHRYPDPLGST